MTTEKDIFADYLSGLGLSPEQISERTGYLGVSDLNYICGDDADRIFKLWEVKTGRSDPEDLSDNVAVNMGSVTEMFNLALFQKKSGFKITDHNTQITHPKHNWLKAQPDGQVGIIPVEAKHVGPFSYDQDKIRERYLPQLAGQMACLGADKAYLTILVGNSKHEYIEVERDEIYVQQVLASASKFWQHVQDDTPPVIKKPDAPVVPHAVMREVDFSMNNMWCNYEQLYLANESSAAEFEAAKKELKSQIESDVRRVTGKFLEANRGKNGAVRFKPIKV
jgi:predicted phage-related endonuclease